MKETNYIIGIFYCTEDNLIFDKIKIPKGISEASTEDIRTLSLRYLGPIFLTKAMQKTKPWTIERIESSLSLRDNPSKEFDMMQSFFMLNSYKEIQGKNTNLFSFIGSPYTEDIKVIYDKMDKLIHPSLLQGNIVNEALMGADFRVEEFIEKELTRGLNLIEYSLGASRKIYWEAPKEYYCVGAMRRKIFHDHEEGYLYTCDEDDPVRLEILKNVPSFYVMSILPNYYEHRIRETLHLFNISGFNPNIRLIKLKQADKNVIYLEEFQITNDLKESYGVILVNKMEGISEPRKTVNYRQKIRQIFDRNKSFEKIMVEINPIINPFVGWGTIEKESLNNIQKVLDESV